MATLASKVQNIPQNFKSGITNISKKFNEFDKKLEKVVCAAFKELKELFSNVISDTYKFLKNHKLSCFTYISAILCGYFNVGNPAHVIALFTITVVHETKSYFTSADHRFKCLAKKYIKSIEDIHKQCRNGKVITNDYEIGISYQTFNELETEVIDQLKKAKDKEQFDLWISDLKNINPSLRVTRKTFPQFVSANDDTSIHAKIFDDAFKKCTNIGFNSYLDILMIHTLKEAKNDYKKLITENAQELIKEHSDKITNSIIADYVKKHEYPNILFKSLDEIAKDLKAEIERFRAEDKE